MRVLRFTTQLGQLELVQLVSKYLEISARCSTIGKRWFQWMTPRLTELLSTHIYVRGTPCGLIQHSFDESRGPQCGREREATHDISTSSYAWYETFN